MTYEKLSTFVQTRMRMSHIYQPVMLMTLLKNDGYSSIKEIARSILSHDQSQIEYYENITKNMVGRVLTNHEIVEKQGNNYKLIGSENLSKEEIQSLINLCQGKLDNYMEERGKLIWQHRKKSAGYISGTLRYEILKKAKFRCELCGISADSKALEVDHIIPRNNGGSDDLSNLQALCYRCNAMKRDRDDTDFRQIKDSYNYRVDDCPFCEIQSKRIIDENELAYSVLDNYPVTQLHTLIIPKRHMASYFDLGRPEINACNSLLENAKQRVEQQDKNVGGFNIGINNGEVAGQTIFHCHIHLIPRRKGDVENPRGGVRHIISGKGNYNVVSSEKSCFDGSVQ